jgi:hypothetical protein
MPLRLKRPYYKQPRGGWHLPYDDTTFYAIGPIELVEKVNAYLKMNGRPPRDVMRDLVLFCQEHWPHLVEWDGESPDDPPSDPLARVMVTNEKLAGQSLKNPPEKEERERREKICAACPHNTPIKGPLMADVNRVSFLLTKGKLCGLGHCTAHGWDNRVAVGWDAAILRRVDSAAVAACWLQSPVE